MVSENGDSVMAARHLKRGWAAGSRILAGIRGGSRFLRCARLVVALSVGLTGLASAVPPARAAAATSAVAASGPPGSARAGHWCAGSCPPLASGPRAA